MAENAVDSAHFRYVHGTPAACRDAAPRSRGTSCACARRRHARRRMGEVDGLDREPDCYGFGFTPVRFTGIVETLLVSIGDADRRRVRRRAVLVHGAKKLGERAARRHRRRGRGVHRRDRAPARAGHPDLGEQGPVGAPGARATATAPSACSASGAGSSIPSPRRAPSDSPPSRGADASLPTPYRSQHVQAPGPFRESLRLCRRIVTAARAGARARARRLGPWLACEQRLSASRSLPALPSLRYAGGHALVDLGRQRAPADRRAALRVQPDRAARVLESLEPQSRGGHARAVGRRAARALRDHAQVRVLGAAVVAFTAQTVGAAQQVLHAVSAGAWPPSRRRFGRLRLRRGRRRWRRGARCAGSGARPRARGCVRPPATGGRARATAGRPRAGVAARRSARTWRPPSRRTPARPRAARVALDAQRRHVGAAAPRRSPVDQALGRGGVDARRRPVAVGAQQSLELARQVAWAHSCSSLARK